MEVLTYLGSGAESDRLYAEVRERIRRRSRRTLIWFGVQAYGYLSVFIVALSGLNTLTHSIGARLIISFLLLALGWACRASIAGEMNDVLLKHCVRMVLRGYSRQNAYEILQRARADTSVYGPHIVNAIVGLYKSTSGGYLTVTRDVVFRCREEQCGHTWGVVVDYPVYGTIENYTYCPKCSVLSRFTLDGALLPDGGDTSVPVLPISVREPYVQ